MAENHPSPPVHGPLFRWLWLPMMKLFAGFLMFLLGSLRVRGKYRVPRKGPVLVLVNHTADIDPVAVQLACTRPIHFMAKSELFSMPALGPFLKLFKAFPVKRGEPDRGALKLAVEYLKAGEVVCVFPEGQLSENGELQELKPGVALIVRMSGAPVICLGVTGTRRLLPYGATIPRPAFRAVHAEWGEPHTFAKDDSTEAILGWIEGQLRSLTT
ncbi:MAG: 1-acyl-sn-glycerol-3-phosphate acyltransferase [Fimbriimonadaceae bacterium]|nr:1-acyl-sn-glycerol-3-phosphate acyltransferase [Chthonomonadaceae bacterium]MCO5296787.1 1-acyl-sn-glycerol-3-phosphate acyltransferase [Fimbriimonadaceae bacterium]